MDSIPANIMDSLHWILLKMPFHIQLLSDLHLDIHEDHPDIPETDADLIILAGDISEGLLGINWAKTQADHLQKPILYLTGNHEYYREDGTQFDVTLKQTVDDHPWVHFMQMDHFDMGQYRILGTTLWTSFDLDGDGTRSLSQWHAWQSMADYRAIRWQDRSITPERTRLWHVAQCQWLEEQLKQAKEDGMTAIVVTHHAPHPRSISPQYANSRLNASFASDLSSLFGQPWSPSYWFHGHTHQFTDYVQDSTRVMANPRGYPEELSSTHFDWAKLIAVDNDADLS